MTKLEDFVIRDKQTGKFYKCRDFMEARRFGQPVDGGVDRDYFKYEGCNLWLEDEIALDVYVPFKEKKAMIKLFEKEIVESEKNGLLERAGLARELLAALYGFRKENT